MELPPRAYAPPEPRKRLLDATYEALAGRELSDLDVADITARSGVSEAELDAVFGSTSGLVAALLQRELGRGLKQGLKAMPPNLPEMGPASWYSALVTAFVQLVLDEPTRWRLILTVPSSAPREYRDDLIAVRQELVAAAESFARAATSLDNRLANLDPTLLAHALLTFAETVGRLAATDSANFPVERITNFTQTAMGILGDMALGNT